MRPRALIICVGLLILSTPTIHAQQTSAISARKAAPKRKPVKKKPRKRAPALPAAKEEEIHADHVAAIARLRDVTNEMKDAELAATVERLKAKEEKRHTLARQLIQRTEAESLEGGGR